MSGFKEYMIKELMEDEAFKDIQDLPQKLQLYKEKFLQFEKDSEGNIDMFGLSRMLERMGKPKTHLEIKRMIKQVDKSKRGTICYRDFVTMMCGPKISVLKFLSQTQDTVKLLKNRHGNINMSRS